MNAWQKFRAIALKGQRRSEPTTAPTPPQPDPRATRNAVLSEWAALPACGEAWLPYLDECILDVDESMSMALQTHPLLCYYMGQKEALVRLRKQFRQWSGQAASPDSER